jgi:hypothetical protein
MRLSGYATGPAWRYFRPLAEVIAWPAAHQRQYYGAFPRSTAAGALVRELVAYMGKLFSASRSVPRAFLIRSGAFFTFFGLVRLLMAQHPDIRVVDVVFVGQFLAVW